MPHVAPDDYFQGGDLDRAADDVSDSRDRRGQGAASCRAHGLQESMRAGPTRVWGRPMMGGARIRSQLFPLVMPPARTSILSPTAAPRTVSVGFGRYLPYTEVAMVTHGRWVFYPVYGALRVALPRSVAALHGGRRLAAAVAQQPAQHGYVLEGDTFVPARLGPGDRHLLAFGGAV